MSNEERYCQAERDYDFMREEKLLESALTDDDHRDESEWRDFLETKVRFFSNALLSKVTVDILRERAARMPEPKSWKGGAEAVEINYALKSLLNKESIF